MFVAQIECSVVRRMVASYVCSAAAHPSCTRMPLAMFAGGLRIT